MQRGGPKIGLGQTITHGMVLRVQLLFFISLLWRFWTLVWWQAALVTYSYGFHRMFLGFHLQFCVVVCARVISPAGKRLCYFGLQLRGRLGKRSCSVSACTELGQIRFDFWCNN